MTKKPIIVELDWQSTVDSKQPKKYDPLKLKDGIDYAKVDKELLRMIAEIDECIEYELKSK